MVKKIVFPKINNFTSEEVKQKFLEILKSIKLNIKYVRLVNIRESLTGLRFYIKTKKLLLLVSMIVLLISQWLVDKE